jgi:hypothetical protein
LTIALVKWELKFILSFLGKTWSGEAPDSSDRRHKCKTPPQKETNPKILLTDPEQRRHHELIEQFFKLSRGRMKR